MKTDHLIDMLARGVEPAERGKHARQMAFVLIVGFLFAALAVSFIGVRPDLMVAPMPVLMKALFSAAAAGAVLPLALRLMRPGRPLGWRVVAVALFVGVAAIVTLIALMGENPENRMRMWMGTGFPWCLVLVPLLAAPTAVGLIWIVRGMAPTRLMLAGAAIGAVSGGIGAMAYAMYCPVDSVAFVTTWYAVAIAICAALGALVGSRFLRW